MNTVSANITDVARHFSDYINRACYGGEHFLLIRGGKPVAEIIPAPKSRAICELPELLGSLPKLSEEDSREFTDDLKKVRSSVNIEEGNSWDV